MVLRGVCLAYVICVNPAVAATADDRAREMAECGYLAHLAVEQMKTRQERPAVFEDVVRDVVDFTNLYYLHKDIERPTDLDGITGEMLFVTAKAGKAVHDARTRAMNPANALKLSNRVLNSCRTDLRLMAKKLKIR